jgi:hypothetical protein
MENLQIINEIINEISNDVECNICFEKFIKITCKEFDKILIDNKEILPETFERDFCCRYYKDRFKCKICKNEICRHCYLSFRNHKIKPRDGWINFYEESGELDDDGMVDACRPGEDCPIICPFCRTKDYKIFYKNKIPYELLNEIKNKRLK